MRTFLRFFAFRPKRTFIVVPGTEPNEPEQRGRKHEGWSLETLLTYNRNEEIATDRYQAQEKALDQRFNGREKAVTNCFMGSTMLTVVGSITVFLAVLEFCAPMLLESDLTCDSTPSGWPITL